MGRWAPSCARGRGEEAIEDRERVERIDVDGFRLTALLVAKLRFERICRGDRSMEAWFHRDPQGFTRAYRAYAS